VALILASLEEMVRFGKMDREVVKQYFGTNYIFDNFKLNHVNRTSESTPTKKK